MRMTIHLAVAFGLLIGLSGNSAAQSCQGFLADQNRPSHTVQLVTLNNKGVASAAVFGVSYRAEGPSAGGGVRPAQWFTDNSVAPKDVAKQLFSDRGAGVGTVKMQPFDVLQADLISVVITAEASPHVTVTLRSWGNVKATFRATCSAGGVLHGSTPDVDYLLFLTQAGLN